MSARWRKLIGSLGILAFLILYIGLVGAASEHLPANPIIQLGYFAAAGILWGVPIIPLITWMNRGR